MDSSDCWCAVCGGSPPSEDSSGGTPQYAPTEEGSTASVAGTGCACEGSAASEAGSGGTQQDAPTNVGSAASEGLSPITAAESSDSGAASDGQWTDSTSFPVAFLSSADAEALIDLYAANPSLPLNIPGTQTPMVERSAYVYLPSSTSTFVIRSHRRGTRNRTEWMVGSWRWRCGAVRICFNRHRRLHTTKTERADPEGGTSQTVEHAQLQENFVTKYIA